MWQLLAGLAGAAIQAGAANQAAQAQAKAGKKQIEMARGIYDDQTALFAPYREAGGNALNALNYEMGLGAAPEGYGGYTASPGYAFQLQEGQRSIDGSAAARGKLFSGETLKAQQSYGQGLAAQNYGNYLNQLYTLSNSGQSAAAQTGNAAQNFGMMGSEALAGIGNARAAGAIGVGNALNNGINNAVGWWGYQNALNGYKPMPTPMGG